MKTFIVFQQILYNGQLCHQPFTKCYGDTIEDANECFLIYLKDRFPGTHDISYCIAEHEMNKEDNLYYKIGHMLHVDIGDLSKNVVSTSWDKEYE